MRGLKLVFLALGGFFVVASGVIWRRSVGIAQARERSALEERRTALEAEAAALEGAIRDASSRARLARIAEDRLGMRIPPESLVILLPRSERTPTPK